MIGDLHCHTTLSDGSLGIEEVILQAKRMNLDYLAITDHDTAAGYARAAAEGENCGLEVVPGIVTEAVCTRGNVFSKLTSHAVYHW